MFLKTCSHTTSLEFRSLERSCDHAPTHLPRFSLPTLHPHAHYLNLSTNHSTQNNSKHHGAKLLTSQKLPIGAPKFDWLIKIVEVARPVAVVTIITSGKGVFALKLKQTVTPTVPENTVDRWNGLSCKTKQTATDFVGLAWHSYNILFTEWMNLCQMNDKIRKKIYY